jgi:hypothetical protein
VKDGIEQAHDTYSLSIVQAASRNCHWQERFFAGRMIANTIFLRHSGRPVAPPEAALSVAAKLRTSFAGPGLTTGSLMEIRWAAAPAIGIWPKWPKIDLFSGFSAVLYHS